MPGMSWEIWLAIALVTVVIGFKWDTGSDFEMYYQSFKELADDGEFSRRDNFEVGYYYFNKFLAVIGCHPIVVFAETFSRYPTGLLKKGSTTFLQ